MPVDVLIAQLLARGDMNEDTVADLNRMLDDFRGNRLDPDDERYLRDLHARLTDSPMPDPELIAAAPSAAPQRLEGLTIEEWRERALRAEAELAQFQEASLNG